MINIGVLQQHISPAQYECAANSGVPYMHSSISGTHEFVSPLDQHSCCSTSSVVNNKDLPHGKLT